MSLTLRNLRAASVREDEAAIARIQARLRTLETAQAAADTALAEAQRAAEDVARERHQLRDIEREMAIKLDTSRAALVQECVGTLPDDVLRGIFEQAVADGRPDAPFALAIVSKRWNRVAMDSPSIWSTIHLRGAGGTHARTVIWNEHNRAVLLLRRSGAAPLDIKGPRSLDGDDGVNYMIYQIITLLGEHVSRWKIARLDLPVNLPSSSLDFLKGPTPLLVELIISGPGNYTELLGGGFLPFAPRLQYLSVSDRAGMGFSTRHGFPAMKRLSFRSCACTDDQMLDVIRASSQSLEQLDLYTPFTHSPSTSLRLPNLKYLCIAEAIISAATQFFVMPALAHLDLGSIPDITDAFLPFLDAVSTTVRRLTVAHALSRSSLSALAHLRNLERLDFKYTASFSSDDALDFLCDNPAVWPRLECVRNLAIRNQSGASSEAILRFIASRTGNVPEANQRAGVTLPCKLRRVTMIQDTPPWMLAEVQRLVES